MSRSDAEIIEDLRDQVAQLNASLDIAEARSTADAATIARYRRRITALTKQRNELRHQLFDRKLAEATERRSRLSALAVGGAR
ncbi:hypothetical protein IU501_22935 [Nocardia otitidiscaviarum]|uniref:hypothetical protein n=1 Tax=Nocardia otitidiscaviarum TaxID=1823 RepID=UPI0004A6B551|nr:hypothetical protein [Nocardia otitidiscaviarum]MBF6135850.1 hypothetical protein [Nocardia otitidiscaviarum]